MSLPGFGPRSCGATTDRHPYAPVYFTRKLVIALVVYCKHGLCLGLQR